MPIIVICLSLVLFYKIIFISYDKNALKTILVCYFGAKQKECLAILKCIKNIRQKN